MEQSWNLHRLLHRTSEDVSVDQDGLIVTHSLSVSAHGHVVSAHCGEAEGPVRRKLGAFWCLGAWAGCRVPPGPSPGACILQPAPFSFPPLLSSAFLTTGSFIELSSGGWNPESCLLARVSL